MKGESLHLPNIPLEWLCTKTDCSVSGRAALRKGYDIVKSRIGLRSWELASTSIHIGMLNGHPRYSQYAYFTASFFLTLTELGEVD